MIFVEIKTMIFITGATGFVGSQLVYDLVSNGERVRALKRITSVIPRKLLPYSSQIEWVDGDVNDLFSLEEAMRGCKKVFHCAAMISFNPKKKKEIWTVNVEGTSNVVNMALEQGVDKLVHVSSIAAIGDAKRGELMTEKHQWEFSKKLSDYSITKHESEREVWRASAEGLNVIIVNPSIILGDGETSSESYRLLDTARQGMTFFTDGAVGMVDVKDVSSAMIALMNSAIVNERFIISSENISYREFFDSVAELFGKKKASIPASPLLLSLAWRMESLLSSLMNREPALTKYMARSANKKYLLSNEKIKRAIGIEFIPIKETIKHAFQQIS
jgi:dihydroflavonol-4-reductase